MNHTKVKICGLTQVEQAIQISEMGVDALGFILYPPSPRYIEPAAIKKIIDKIPPLVKTVGVFVNESVESLKSMMDHAGLDLAQLSGDESPSYCQSLSDLGIRWIKAIRVKDQSSIDLIKTYPTKDFLVDAWSKTEYGGTGETFDWGLIKQLSGDYRLTLAGGLNERNVQEAIDQVQPYAVDVSSGVEIKPGVKSISKVRTLLNSLKG